MADWPAGVVSRERLMSGVVELLLSDRRGGADWSWFWFWFGALLASVAALPSTMEANRVLPSDGSEDDLAGRGEGP